MGGHKNGILARSMSPWRVGVDTEIKILVIVERS